MAESSRALLVRLGERTFALEASAARGVIAPERVTGVPRTGSLLLGLVPVRGSITPLVDLAGLLEAGSASMERAVVAEANGQTFAFPVDEVLGFSALQAPLQPDQLSTPQMDASGSTVIEALNPTRIVQVLAERLADR